MTDRRGQPMDALGDHLFRMRDYVQDRLAGLISAPDGIAFDGPVVVWKKRRAVVGGAARQVHGLAPPPDGAASGPVTMNDLTLTIPFGVRCVLHEVQLHRQLPDLAFKGGDPGLVFGDDACLGFLARQLSALKLRQPQMYEVRGNLVRACAVHRAGQSHRRGSAGRAAT